MTNADQEQPPQRTLIEHLRFALTVDEADNVLTDATLLIEGSRIADIGPHDEVLKSLMQGSFDCERP